MYGYRNLHRQMQTGKLALNACVIILLVVIRSFMTSPAVKTVISLAAIIAVIPAANIASPLIASWKYKTPSIDFYNEVAPFEEKGIMLYDLIITTKEQIIPMDAILVHPYGVYAYCPLQKVDAAKAQMDLNTVLKDQKLSQTIKIFKEEKQFFSRLDSIRPMSSEDDDGSTEFCAELLKNLAM